MAKLMAVIGADTSGLVKSLTEAKSVLDKYTKEAKNSSTHIQGVTEAQIASYERVVKALDKVASGTLSTKQQEQALASQIQELQVQWANLSESARSSDFGKSLSDSCTSAQEQLKQLQVQLGQVGSMDGTAKQMPLKAQLKKLQNELTALTAQYRAMNDAEKQSASGQALAKKMDELRAKAGTLKDTIGDVSEEIKVMASDTPNLDVFNDVIGISGDALSTYSSILAKVTGDEESLKNAIATVMAVQSTANLLTKVTNALQSSSAIMLKTRAIQEGAAATAIKIRTLAENKGTIATGAATVAQKVFNAVAKANPYVLLATAALGVATALYAFSSSTSKATEKEKELQREAEATKKKLEEQKHASEALGNKTGDLIGSFKVLQSQWNSLKTVADKKEWIKNNQTAFDNLNLSVWNVNDAYDVFVKNAPKVIAALKAIAEAEAYQDLYKDAIKKKATEWDNRQKSKETGDYYTKVTDNQKQTGFFTPDEWQKANLEQGKDYTVKYDGEYTGSEFKLTKEGIDKINKYRNDQALKTRQQMEKGYQDEVDRFGALMDAANEKAETAKAQLASLGGTGTKPGTTTTKHTPSNTKDKPEAVSGSLSDLENQLSELKKKYKDGILKITPDDYQKQVKELEAQIQNKKLELGIEILVEDGSIQKLNDQLAQKEKLLKLAIDDESRQQIQREIDEILNQKAQIELKLKPVVEGDDIDKLKDRLSKHTEEITVKVRQQTLSPKGDKAQQATTKADNLKEELDFQKEILESYQEQYKAIQEKVRIGGTLNTNEEKLVSIYDEAKEKVEALSGAYLDAAKNAELLQTKAQFNKKLYSGIKGTVKNLGSLNNSVVSVTETWKNLGENWDDMSTFEKVTSSISSVIGTIDEAISAYESINEIIKMFGEIAEASSAKKIAADSAEMAMSTTKTTVETANTQTKLANDTAENTSELGKIGVKEAGAIASATASGASLPFPANLAAIAAGIAAVVAAFAMIASFADGGIIGGTTTIGDYNIARVNKGEMILNGSQQKKLFNILNGNGDTTGDSLGTSGNVTFRIKGQNLVGVLRNHNSKMKKI